MRMPISSVNLLFLFEDQPNPNLISLKKKDKKEKKYNCKINQYKYCQHKILRRKKKKIKLIIEILQNLLQKF
jgi:hypothetical protein